MRAWAALVLVAFVLVGGLTAYQGALQDSADSRIVQDEGFSSPSAGEIISVSKAGNSGVYFNENHTVLDENSNKMTDGTDYIWFSNGSFKVLDGGDLAGDADGTVTYEYQQVTSEQQEQAEFVALLYGNAGFIVLIVIVLILIGITGAAR